MVLLPLSHMPPVFHEVGWNTNNLDKKRMKSLLSLKTIKDSFIPHWSRLFEPKAKTVTSNESSMHPHIPLKTLAVLLNVYFDLLIMKRWDSPWIIIFRWHSKALLKTPFLKNGSSTKSKKYKLQWNPSI